MDHGNPGDRHCGLHKGIRPLNKCNNRLTFNEFRSTEWSNFDPATPRTKLKLAVATKESDKSCNQLLHWRHIYIGGRWCLVSPWSLRLVASWFDLATTVTWWFAWRSMQGRIDAFVKMCWKATSWKKGSGYVLGRRGHWSEERGRDCCLCWFRCNWSIKYPSFPESWQQPLLYIRRIHSRVLGGLITHAKPAAYPQSYCRLLVACQSRLRWWFMTSSDLYKSRKWRSRVSSRLLWIRHGCISMSWSYEFPLSRCYLSYERRDSRFSV